MHRFLIPGYMLLIFLIGMYHYKNVSRPIKLLIIYIGLTFISESASAILAATVKNNMIVFHIFAPIEYLFYTAIYRQILGGKIGKVITYAAIPVMVFCLVNSLFIQKTNTFPSNFLLSYQVIFLLYALMGFRKLLLDADQKALYAQSVFWLNIALMLFSTTLFLYFGLLNYVIRHQLNFEPLQIFSQTVNILYYILLSIAIIIDGNKTPKLKFNEEH